MIQNSEPKRSTFGTKINELQSQGSQVFRILYEFIGLRKSINMNESEIEDYQNRKLRKLITHAYETVPFYRKLFDKNRVDPSSIQRVSDLNLLPIIEKGMLRKIPFNEKVSQLFIERPLRTVLTGGSTGEPFKIWITREEGNRRVAHRLRILLFHGCARALMFNKEATVAGMSGMVKRQWSDRLGILRKVEVPFDASMSKQVKVILHEKPDIFWGYPSRLHQIARYLIDNRVVVKAPKAIFADSETLLPIVREEIEKGFGSEVTNVYDSYEFGYVAWECKMHKGMHINCDSQVVQITKDNVELKDGQCGNITVTDLDNYAMPLIRYDTGDIGTKSKRRCNCGLAFPLLDSVSGRKWDLLLSPLRVEIPPLLVEQFVRRHKGIVEYQVIQNSVETLNVDIVVSDGYDYNADNQIRKKLESLYGFKDVTINHPRQIEKTASGKLRCVVRNF